MKKTLLGCLVALTVLLNATDLKAQAYQQGDKLVNVGIGLVGLGLNVTGEYLINDQIGIGAFVGYEHRTYSYLYGINGGDYGRSDISFGVRGAFHAGKLLSLDSKFDPYIAAGLGINIYRDPYWDYNYNTGDYVSKSFVRPTLLFRLGGRYYFSEKMAAFGEVGSGGSVLSGGISFKF